MYGEVLAEKYPLSIAVAVAIVSLRPSGVATLMLKFALAEREANWNP